VGFDEGPADGESESEAAELTIDEVSALFEGLEEVGEGVGVDAHAGVGDLDLDGAIWGIGCGEGDGAAVRGEFDGVGEEVPEDLLEACEVAADGVVGGVELEVELEVFGLGGAVDDGEGLLEGQMEGDGFESEGEFAIEDAVDIEEVIEEASFEFEVSCEHGEVFAEGLGRVGLVLPARDGEEYGGEGSAEFVAEFGEELVFFAGGGFGGFLGVQEFEFALFACGDVLKATRMPLTLWSGSRRGTLLVSSQRCWPWASRTSSMMPYSGWPASMILRSTSMKDWVCCFVQGRSQSVFPTMFWVWGSPARSA